MSNDRTDSSETFPFKNDPYLEDCNITSLNQHASLIIGPLLEAVLLSFSIFLNVTIIAVVCCTKRLHTVQHVFIVSLAISDVISASVISFMHSYEVYGMVTQRPCELVVPITCISSFLTVFGILSNIGNHLMISTERWLYIALPFIHQRIITRNITILCLVSVWVISSAANFNLFFDRCGLHELSTRVNIGIVSPVFHFTLSFIMFLMYSHITFITYRHTHCINKTRMACTGTQAALKIRTLVSTKWRSIRMLVTVFGTFFVLVTPSVITDIYAYTQDKDFYDCTVGKIVDFIWSTHCFMNFCIYMAQDRVFRSVLKQRLLKTGCFLFSKQVHPEDSSVLYFKTIYAHST